MGHRGIAYYLGNLICKITDLQLSKFVTFCLKIMVSLMGIFTLSLIFFKAIDQSLTEHAFQGFFNSTYLGIFMMQYSSTEVYQLLLDITTPLLFLFSFLVGPFFLILFRILIPCEDFKMHRAYKEYDQEKTLKRLTDNLSFEKYSLRYGIDRIDHEDIKDTYYLETFRVNQKLFSKENIFIRVYVYPQIFFQKYNMQIQRQIEDSFTSAKELINRHGRCKINYIVPIFIVENSDIETKRFIVKQYHKEGRLSLLPVLYNGAEDWWFHKRAKRPFIISILKTLVRNNNPLSSEEIERQYQEANYFLKGKGYDYYRNGCEYFEKGKYKQALKQFLIAARYAKSDRDSCQAYTLIGICHNQLYSKNESIKAFKTALQYNSKNYDAWEWLGVVYSEYNDYEKALPCFEKCHIAFPDNVNYACRCANAYIQLQQYNNAIAILTRIMPSASSNRTVLSWLSLAHAGIGEREKATYYYERISELGHFDMDYLMEEIETLLENSENQISL
jgi:tetratricopeptide (TPR) repeat protein